MKRIMKLQEPSYNYCIKSYRDYINNLYKNARDGKDPNCTKCDEHGNLKNSFVLNLRGGKTLEVPEPCECVKRDKQKIEPELLRADKILQHYETLFGNLDNDLTLDIFAKRFNQNNLINTIKRYLYTGSCFSLYLSGESGIGKTTILKMLWQIYALNNIKASYMKASIFEDMHKNLFNKNAKCDGGLKQVIDAKIENVKFADIIMIDDIDSIGFHYAAEGYYKLFDKIRALEKTVILTSNKSYSSLMDSLNIKTRKDNIEEIKGRLTSRLKNLNIIELEMQKSENARTRLA